jgi:hypothetical protein
MIAPLPRAEESITLAANEAPLFPVPAPLAPPQPLGAVPQAKRMLAGWLPRGTGVFEAPPPVAVVAPPVSMADEMAEIDLALSVAVAGPPDTWNLPQLRERLRLAATRSNSNPDRLRADAIDARIARFEAIQSKQQSFAAGPPTDPSPLRILSDVFGYSSFRGPQEDIVNHVVNGGDALVLMPTGGGKSLCYQIPAIARQQAGLTYATVRFLSDAVPCVSAP